ncbi:MAG: hypothetical protein R2788_19825 [Saprospiraceae bacterium]
MKNEAKTSEAPVWMNETEEGFLLPAWGHFHQLMQAVLAVIYLQKTKQLTVYFVDRSKNAPFIRSCADMDNDGRFLI